MIFKGSNRVLKNYVIGFLIVLGLLEFLAISAVAGKPHDLAKFGITAMDILPNLVSVDRYSTRMLDSTVEITSPGRFILYTNVLPDPQVQVTIYSVETGEEIPSEPNMKFGETILDEEDDGLGVPLVTQIPAWHFTIKQAGSYRILLTPLSDTSPSFVLVTIKQDVRLFNYLFLIIGSLVFAVVVGAIGYAIYYYRNKEQLAIDEQGYKESRSKWDKFKEQ